jgi:hypothetical protein
MCSPPSPAKRIDQLLPWNWRPADETRAAARTGAFTERLLCFPPRPRNSTSGSRNIACLSTREACCTLHPRMLMAAVGTEQPERRYASRSGCLALTRRNFVDSVLLLELRGTLEMSSNRSQHRKGHSGNPGISSRPVSNLIVDPLNASPRGSALPLRWRARNASITALNAKRFSSRTKPWPSSAKVA